MYVPSCRKRRSDPITQAWIPGYCQRNEQEYRAQTEQHYQWNEMGRIGGLLIWEEIRLRYMGGEVPDNNAFNQLGDKEQIKDGTI